MSVILLGVIAALGLYGLYEIYRSTMPPIYRSNRAEEARDAFLEGAVMGFDARRTARELTLINQASESTRSRSHGAYREGLAMGRDTHENNMTMVHGAYREGVAMGCEVFERGAAMGFAKANETISAVTSSTSSRNGDVRLSTSNSRTSLRPGRDGSGRITHRSDSRRRGDDSSYGSDDNIPRRSDGVVANDRGYAISSEDGAGNLPRGSDDVVMNDIYCRSLHSGNLPRGSDTCTCGSGYSELRARERRHNGI